MKIILDTNIFCQDYHLEKPHFRTLLEGCSVIPATIHIPEVVFDEVVNRYKEDLLEAKNKYDSTIRSLNSLIKQELSIDIDLSNLVEQYKSFLLASFQERNIEIVPYPDTPHKKIVERDLARKKPFKRNGSGYRDYLIGETVKKLCTWGENQIAFITNNSKDFGEGPHVDKELAEEMHNNRRLKVYNSLKMLNDELIVPKLNKLEEIKTQLQEAKLREFDIRQWLSDNLLNLLRNYDLESIIAGFPDGIGSARISDIIEFRDIKINDVSALENNNKLLSIYVDLFAQCRIDSDFEDYMNHPEVRKYWGRTNEPFTSISTSVDENIRMTVDLVISGETNKVDAEETITIEADYGKIAFG